MQRVNEGSKLPPLLPGVSVTESSGGGNEQWHHGERDEDEDDPSPPQAFSASSSSSSSSHQTTATTSSSNTRRRNVLSFFTPGETLVAGIPFTTTKQALGFDSFLKCYPEAEELASTDKSTTFHGLVQGRHLVWRQIDVYKLPRSNKEFTDYTLAQMVTRELETYVHLRENYGRISPEFIYFGQDFNMLWVFVTKYEGESLVVIAERKEGLTLDEKRGARESLVRLHSLGVLHGDASLRNVVRRAEDGVYLWIDFEFSKLTYISEDTQLEREQFDEELDEYPTIVMAPPFPPPQLDSTPQFFALENRNDGSAKGGVIPSTSRKRTKVFACGSCCTWNSGE